MKKIFKLTIFKKMFLVVFCGFMIIESIHIYLDYKNELYNYAYRNKNDLIVERMKNVQQVYQSGEKQKFRDKFFDSLENINYDYAVLVENDTMYVEMQSFITSGIEVGKPILIAKSIDEKNPAIVINTENFTPKQIQTLETQLTEKLDKDQEQDIVVRLSGKEKIVKESVSTSEKYYIEIVPTYLIVGGRTIIGDEMIVGERNDDYEHNLILTHYQGKDTIYLHRSEIEPTKYVNYKVRLQKLESAAYDKKFNNGIHGTLNIDYVVDGQDLITVQYYYLEDVNNVYNLAPYSNPMKIMVMKMWEDGASKILNEVIYNKQNIYIVAFVLSIAMSLIISYLLTKRIKKIDIITKKISENNFDEKLNEKSQDEIGTLSHNINLMSIQLKHTIEQLNNEINQVKKLEGLRKEFIANFTHEMKTPLGIINGYIELIEDSHDEKKTKQYLSAIEQETKKINDLVLAMLNLSRLESGKVELKKEKIDIDDLVSSVIDSYATLLEKKEIQVHVQGESFLVECDIEQMTMVIQNFMSNAMKHTPERMNIQISYQGHKVSIINEGSHIKDEDMKTIWDTYVSSDREGTGLGLAICKAILELHKFEYGVYNKDNGVCFYFETE